MPDTQNSSQYHPIIHESKYITYKGLVVFEKIRMNSYKRIPKLFQANEACFMFINEGEMNVRSQDTFISFRPGDGLLAKCFNYFFEMNEGQRKDTKIVEVMGVLLHPSMMVDLYDVLPFNSSQQQAKGINKIELNNLLINFRENISILLDHPDLADEKLILSKLREFVILISKAADLQSKSTFLSQMFNPEVYHLKNAVENNLFSDLKISEFAHLCNLSVASFNRKFKSIYKQSPKKYLLERKLQKALQMLHIPTYRIADIAFECGFENISSFNRAFKKAYQLSPSDYRKDKLIEKA